MGGQLGHKQRWLGARGSLRDLTEKGPLFRKGSSVCRGMYGPNNGSQDEKKKKSNPKPCKLLFRSILILLTSYHCFCFEVLKEKKMSLNTYEVLDDDKTVFPSLLAQARVCGRGA